MHWSCVCPLLGLDLPWTGWSSPSYRRSPGQPALSAHFAEHNSPSIYSKTTPPPSWFSCGSRMTIVAGWRRTPWLTTVIAWYEPHRENVEWGEKDNAANLACPPSQKQRWAMGPCVRRVGWSCVIYALHSINDWVHDTTNEIRGWSRRVLDFLLKKSISGNSPFKG